MILKVNRDSVCMGDDVSDHAIEMTVGETEVFSKFIRRLIELSFFPFVSGNDVVWTLYCGGIDVCSYLTKRDCIYTAFVHDEPSIIQFLSHREEKNVFFKYFISPEKRAEYIFKQNAGSHYHIWHEGYINEYRIYNISDKKENKWSEELGEMSKH